MRVGFAGTPVFAAVALQALLDAGHTVPLVLTQPDRPAGRGMKLQPSPVKAVALAQGLPVHQPMGLRLQGKYPDDAAAAQAALQAAQLDAMVVAAYGLILPAWVLSTPRLGCFNIHASLLPRWRGAAPIHRAIEAGDAETGVTIMQMDEGLDTGDMLLLERTPLDAQTTTARLHDTLAHMGGTLMCQVLQDAEAGRLRPVPQPSEGVTYAHKIEKAEAVLDWTLPAEGLARRVRAFDPFPGGVTTWAGDTLKVWAAQAMPHHTSAAPGTVLPPADATLAEAVWVQTGQGCLVLTALQRPGGKRLDAAAFLRAQAVPAGTVLGGLCS